MHITLAVTRLPPKDFQFQTRVNGNSRSPHCYLVGAIMLEVECEKCKRRFHVEGHTTPDGFWEPGEVVTELECEDELCQCLRDGGAFIVVDESHAVFDDDVI